MSQAICTNRKTSNTEGKEWTSNTDNNEETGTLESSDAPRLVTDTDFTLFMSAISDLLTLILTTFTDLWKRGSQKFAVPTDADILRIKKYIGDAFAGFVTTIGKLRSKVTANEACITYLDDACINLSSRANDLESGINGNKTRLASLDYTVVKYLLLVTISAQGYPCRKHD